MTNSEHKQGEVVYSRNEIKWLRLKPELYAPNPAIYAQGESPDDRQEKLIENPKNVKSRENMLKSLEVLKKRLVEFDEDEENNEESYDRYLVREISGIGFESLLLIEDEVERKNTQDFLLTGLLQGHLEEVGDSAHEFGKNIPDELLDKRKKILMVFAGKTHDICKLLGTMNAQIDPDHEIIYKEIIGPHLVGKKFVHEGETIVFNQDDVDFITSLVGFHEDIHREKYFASKAESLKKDTPLKEPEKSVQRARTIFHCLDIYGSAIGFENGKLKILNQKNFKSRFIDLFQRHIKLPLKSTTENGINWSMGKVFRPEWGEHGVIGLTHTFELLQEWGVKVDPELVSAVENGILEVLNKAENAIENSNGEYARTDNGAEDLKTYFDNIVATKERMMFEINARQQRTK